jgi:hypothetical protein
MNPSSRLHYTHSLIKSSSQRHRDTLRRSSPRDMLDHGSSQSFSLSRRTGSYVGYVVHVSLGCGAVCVRGEFVEATKDLQYQFASLVEDQKRAGELQEAVETHIVPSPSASLFPQSLLNLHPMRSFRIRTTFQQLGRGVLQEWI